MTDQDTEKLEKSLKKVIDSHGYGFQYAVLEKIKEIYDLQQLWLFEVAEFPVATKGHETRIDFVLKPKDFLFYLVAECKRVNPSFSDWCFIRAPYVSRNHKWDKLIVENVTLDFSQDSIISTHTGDEYHPARVESTGVSLCIIDNAYHIGLQLKRHTDEKENNPKSRGAIEEAAGQVLKGLNGFVNVIPKIYNNRSGASIMNIRIMPAIFTTASLWTTDVKLNRAKIENGELPVDSVKLIKRPWIYFQYPVSQGLRHYFKTRSATSLQQIYLNDYLRTIAIISYDGIEDFFTKFVRYRSKAESQLVDD